jgi:hypothetical protein
MQNKAISWDFLSKIAILVFLLLQCIRWSVLLQSMDIYYHLLTAWGFIQAEGYSGWDFWQYAPVGRIHIYPPFFHLMLAGLLKSGVSQIIMAKLCEVIIPTIFLGVLWNFIRVNFSKRLAFFVLLMFFSSFSYYLSVTNHLPATLASIFGILSLGQFFKNKIVRSALLLSLCFYTHIGVSWFFFLTFILYAAFNKEARREALLAAGLAFFLSLPVIIKEVNGLRFLTTAGLNLNEKYLSQVKVIDLLLACAGLFIALKAKGKHSLFLAFFVASFIFIIYPYRFLSGEGYFSLMLLCALFLSNLYNALNRKYMILIIAVFTLVISPTWVLYKNIGDNKLNYKINVLDSGFINLLMAKGRVLWFPKEYLSAANIVRENSGREDIIFSSLNFIGLTVSSLAGRATANALLPEIKLPDSYNPLVSSRIIIFSKIDDPNITDRIISALNLTKVGENDFFAVYKNPGCNVRLKANKAVLTFKLVLALFFLWLLAFWQARRLEKYLNKVVKNI